MASLRALLAAERKAAEQRFRQELTAGTVVGRAAGIRPRGSPSPKLQQRGAKPRAAEAAVDAEPRAAAASRRNGPSMVDDVVRQIGLVAETRDALLYGPVDISALTLPCGSGASGKCACARVLV